MGVKRSKIISISLMVLLAATISVNFKSGYGDGLTQENLPPASVGDRDASLFIKISPPILTKQNIGDTTVELKLFDAKTGEAIKHTSFFVTVDKGGKLLMRNLFHTHSGDLLLKVQPTNIPLNEVVVFGDQEPFQGGWTSINDQISVKAPVLLDAGLYHFEIEIFGIDNDRNIFIPEDAPKFDSWLSVGDIYDQKVSYQGKSHDLSITSYYDRISNFNFDENSKVITFSMPFNWDISRLEKQNVFVHEEIHFPDSFNEFAASPSFKASVNGYPVTGRMLIADPYSLENTLILHYLISKDNIMEIAKVTPQDSKSMEFKLAPESSNIEKNTINLTLDSGANVQVQYDKNAGPGVKTPFELTFFDKDGKLLKFVRHGFNIKDSSGKKIYEFVGNDPNNIGMLSTEGIDTQELTFPSEGQYTVTVAIFSHGQDNLQTFQGIGNTTFEIGPAKAATSTSIPSWIKNNAGWWADGQIDDNAFVQGIQYLIKEGIMKVPVTTQGTGSSNQIPSWIKNNAGWWADGQIDDNAFVQGIQYLIKEGIMKIQ